nr:hypothetical protein [Mastigocladopsis repens]
MSYFNWIWQHSRFKTTAAQRAGLADRCWSWHEACDLPHNYLTHNRMGYRGLNVTGECVGFTVVNPTYAAGDKLGTACASRSHYGRFRAGKRSPETLILSSTYKSFRSTVLD